MKIVGDLVALFAFIAIAALFFNKPEQATKAATGLSGAYVGALQGAAKIGA